MARNQTVSYLKNRFAEVGISAQKRHGQNFLIDLNLLNLLADAADLQPNDVVLEIGTGTGSLTGLLALHAHHVITVEIDPAMYQLASEELIDYSNITLVHQDALKNKNNLEPGVLELVRSSMAELPDPQFKLAANLPYNVATPILSNLLTLETPPVTMTVTIQKELADRIVAQPSTKDYSALSVWVQSQCQCKILRILPPEVFWPRPKVTSAILQLVIDPEKRDRISDRKFFHEFVRALFFHRRKLLRSVVSSAFKHRLEKTVIDEVMLSENLGPETRAEELSVEQILQLSDAIQKVVLLPEDN